MERAKQAKSRRSEFRVALGNAQSPVQMSQGGVGYLYYARLIQESETPAARPSQTLTPRGN
ncbi:MAG: hypothetical protein ACRC8Y_20610 [Chroococcales cyanobacterium]